MLIAAGETRGVNNKNTTTQNGLNQPTFNYDRAKKNRAVFLKRYCYRKGRDHPLRFFDRSLIIG